MSEPTDHDTTGADRARSDRGLDELDHREKDTGPGTGPGWRRLDARMLLVHPVRELIRFLPALVGIFVLGRSGDRHGPPWELIGVAIPIVLGLLRYATTSYRITAGQIELRRGLLERRILTARLDRVRTVALTASPIHRVLGLARVAIGTASAQRGDDDNITLDALAVGPARALRTELLHRAEATPQATAEAPTTAAPTAATPAYDEVLVRLDPAWMRYAPLTTSGLVIALGTLGVGSQVLNEAVRTVRHTSTVQRVEHLPLLVALLAGLVALLVAVSVLATLGYVLANWGFTLSRDAAGRSFHIRQGLLTSRETSIDADRLRGVEVHEPLGLRLAGGGRLAALVTGLGRRSRSPAALVPPAPAAVVHQVAGRVLAAPAPDPLTLPLVGHGPRARRRRYLRAGWGALAVTVVVVVSVLLGAPAWLLTVIPVAVVGAAALAHDRAARLGHALHPAYLVMRSGSLSGRRDVLQATGIIGWNLRQTYFQRRAGLCTLTATTAAGRQGYAVYDVPLATAVTLADRTTPGLLTPFLEPTPPGRVPGPAERTAT